MQYKLLSCFSILKHLVLFQYHLPWILLLELLFCYVVIEEEDKTTYKNLNLKLSNWEKEIPDTSTSIYTSEQILEKKIEDIDKKKILDICRLVTATALNTKTGEVESKITNASDSVATTVSNTKICEVENKTLGFTGLVTTSVLNVEIKERIMLNVLLFLNLIHFVGRYMKLC